MLIPIGVLGLVLAAIGLGVGLIGTSDHGVGLVVGGACVMIPISALIDLLIIQIAYKLHKAATRSQQRGDT